MPIYDNDGTANRQVALLYHNDGTANGQIAQVYDNDGAASRLVYQYQVVLFTGVLKNFRCQAYQSDSGWQSKNYTVSATSQEVDGYNGNVYAKASVSTKGLVLYGKHGAIGYNGCRILCTNAVDLTNYTKLTVTGLRSKGTAKGQLGLYTAVPSASGVPNVALPTGAAATVALPATTAAGNVTLNVASLKGKYYIALGLYIKNADNADEESTTVTRIVAS